MSRESGGSQDDRLVELGELVGLHGVRGWLKLRSYCEPWEGIFEYRPWRVGEHWVDHVEGRRQGKTLVCRLPDIRDRDAAAAYVGKTVSVSRSALPEPESGHWYWSDLVGLEVLTKDNVQLGSVVRVFATGANDVIVVRGEKEHLIPLVSDRFVLSVDLAGGQMRVDWDPEF